MSAFISSELSSNPTVAATSISPAMGFLLCVIVFFGSGLSGPYKLMKNFQMDVHDFNKANALGRNSLLCGKKLDRFCLSN